MIKNTADQTIHFALISATDGTAVTVGSPSVYVTIEGGSQISGSGGTPVHEGNGQWSYTPTQAETNGDSIGFIFVLAGAIPASIQIYPVSAAVSQAVETAESTASLTAHLSKLEAVNQMLRSINEQPVSSLGSGEIDAERAEDILDETSRRIQSQGWHANTRRNVKYTPNASNQFVVGTNVLSIDAVNPKGRRMSTTPTHSRHVNVMLKRSADDSKWLLYDVDNDSETITDLTEITCDVIEYLTLAHLPPSLQIYIYKAAAHEFQKTSVASQILYQFTLEDVEVAAAEAMQDDWRNDDANVLKDRRSAWEITYRYNPTYGT